MTHEVIVIGSGPAGLTAGIYLGRLKRNPLIIDGNQPGGQLTTTGLVENWPGEVAIDGPVLMKKIREQAEACGVSFLADLVERVDFSSSPFAIFTKNSEKLLTRSVIIATGSSPRRLGVPGEDEYWGKGVAVCATCDAPLYEDHEVVVVGGGNSAVAESYALSKHAKKVTIIQIHDRLTATDPLTEKVLKMPNVSVLYNKKVVGVKGDGESVASVVLEDRHGGDGKITEFSTEGVFVAIGMVPNSGPFRNILETDDSGYVLSKETPGTSVPGVFVAGDVFDRKYRQAITAAGQGCAAALACEEWLRSLSL
ncbi:FAD-dependent oxidoreductase [Candidatus Dependentiae bacterium]|nr:FAD-dependent oxidoreductase [Candidatus Dependentiae bacterium]